MDTLMSEKELIQAAINGDSEAFGELVKQNEKRIYSFALGMLSDPDDAFDVSQDTFMKAYRSIKFFEGKSSFYTWLYSICRNCCYDYIKAKGRRMRHNISLHEYESEEDGTTLEIADNESRPDVMYEKQRTMELIRNAISLLPDNHREIILLRDINGLSYEEVAQSLGISEGTVKSRLNRARHRLQTLLKDIL